MLGPANVHAPPDDRRPNDRERPPDAGYYAAFDASDDRMKRIWTLFVAQLDPGRRPLARDDHIAGNTGFGGCWQAGSGR